MLTDKRIITQIAIAAAVAAVSGSLAHAAGPWSFGVMGDTQWTVADTQGQNPNTVAANIIKQVDAQFIAANVKLVVAVGDMADNGTPTTNATRALYAQDLYNAGIGFFPMRGNHEAANGDPANLTSGSDLLYAYPQVTGGSQNATPASITTAVIPALDLANNAPAAKTGSAFSVGTNYTAPSINATPGDTTGKGVSYAFQYNNATFMALDQFTGGDYYGSTIPAQQGWIDSTLSSRPAGTQAFVFTHKNILGGNHKDNMFGGQINSSDPGDGYGVTGLSPADQATLAAKQTAENNFLASMQNNNVKYVISGHDHHDYVSVVTSPDGKSQVHQIISQSDSSKFYTPGAPVSANDTPIQQVAATKSDGTNGQVGYYIYTVDGPRVTMDYYGADATTKDATGKSVTQGGNPTFNFAKWNTSGYSLNGKEVVVSEGGAYTSISDDTTNAIANQIAYGETGFLGTRMAILGGTNGSTATTNYGKAFSKAIDTGWAPAGAGQNSDQLTLWGMSDLSTSATDIYALSISYDPSSVGGLDLSSGALRLQTLNSDGTWIDAVDADFGGTKNFVLGAYSPGYGLGTYGVDPTTDTAWAVLNHASVFVVATPEPASLALLAMGGIGLLLRRRRV